MLLRFLNEHTRNLQTSTYEAAGCKTLYNTVFASESSVEKCPSPDATFKRVSRSSATSCSFPPWDV